MKRSSRDINHIIGRCGFPKIVKTCMLLLVMWLGMMSIYSQMNEGVVLNQADVYVRFVDSEGYEWYGTRDGLKRYDSYSYETFRSDRNHPELLRSNDVMCISEDSMHHDIWFGTKEGAYVLSKKDYSIEELHISGDGGNLAVDSMELTDKRINYLLCSRDGQMWISYRNQILVVDSNSSVAARYATTWNGKNRSSIQLLEDPSSCIWTNLWNGGICRKPKNSDAFTACEWTDPNYPSDLSIDPSGKFIVATTPDGRTYRYAFDGTLLKDTVSASPEAAIPPQYVSNEEKSRLEALLNEHILCITKDEKQNVYIGTFDNIYRQDAKGGDAELLVGHAGRIHDICTDSGTVYFISNAKGLCKYSGGHVENIAKGNNFSSLTIDGGRSIWLSNRMGNVYKTRDEQNAILADDSIAGNLNGDAVESVRSDGYGRLWIMSRHSLKEYNTKNGGCKIINSKDLPVGSFNTIYLEEGGICLEGTDGVIHLKNTDALSSQNEIKRVAVTSYTIGSRHELMPYGIKSLDIDSGIDNITFFLTSFVYDNAKHIIYSYRLDNGDYHELDRGANILSLSSIPYGTHTISVKGKDSYGRWSDAFDVVTIIHPRPWYHYALWSAGILAVMGFVVWYARRTRRFRRKVSERMKRYEKEKEMLEQKLHDAEAKARDMGYKESVVTENYSTLSVQDKEFVDRCREMVEKNLSNIEYGVDALSADLCMSRMNLYRKLRGLTGQSPTDFIRNIRLERALMLLETTSYSMNEISDLVGFSYPSYFTKCFKDKFGKSPKEWRESGSNSGIVTNL